MRPACATTWSARPTPCDAAPADYEQRLRDSKLGDPVLVVPPTFAGRAGTRRGPGGGGRVISAANQRSQSGTGPLLRLLRGYNQEQATLRLAVRGVAPGLLEAVRVEERDLADPASRAAQLGLLVPYFVLMAVLYGALNAALDTTAGERERGSLEPLLMNPSPRARRWWWASGARWPAWPCSSPRCPA